MVNSILQRLYEQRDTRIVAIRSAKLSINVLLAHWHHVRTTDTVIVSTYSKFLVSLHPLPTVLSFHERKALPSCVLALIDILEHARSNLRSRLRLYNFAPETHTLLRILASRKRSLWLASITLLFFLPRSHILKVAQVAIKNLIKSKCISQLRGTYGGDTFNVGRKFRLWYIPAVCEPLAAVCTESNSLFRLRG